MRGLWLEGQALSLRDDLPVPVPGPGEALLRVRRAGVCGTDLQMLRGYHPFTGIPGHEFVGEVLEAPGAPHWRGRRVVGDINVSCGRCGQCRAGRRRHCEQREVLGIRQHHGVFAERVTLPVANLYAVPDAVGDDEAVFAEPLAAALRIGEQLDLEDARVLLVGAGRLGQLIARALHGAGCDLRVVARHERQRELLTSAGIAWLAEEAVEARCADVVVEASGNPAALDLARRAVRPQGTIVLKSTHAGLVELDLASLVVDEVRLLGSRCGPMDAAIAALARGAIDVRPLVDGRYELGRGVAAIDRAGRRGVLKILIRP